MYTVDGHLYDFHFTLARVELIEKACGAGLMDQLAKCGGMLPLGVLKACTALALRGDDDAYLPAQAGFAHAERLIEENGYAAVALAVVEALQRDCPFFFRAA